MALACGILSSVTVAWGCGDDHHETHFGIHRSGYSFHFLLPSLENKKAGTVGSFRLNLTVPACVSAVCHPQNTGQNRETVVRIQLTQEKHPFASMEKLLFFETKKVPKHLIFSGFTRFASIVSWQDGWASWIRTSGMTESKSVALPLGDGPVLQSGKSACGFAALFEWGGRWDSNPRHPEPQSGAATS